MSICFGTGPYGDFYECVDRPCPYQDQGRVIRRARKYLGWSLSKFADAIGVGIAEASDFERGYALMSKEQSDRFLESEP